MALTVVRAAAALALMTSAQAAWSVTNWTDWAIPGAFPLTNSAPATGYTYAQGTTGNVTVPGGSAVSITLTGEVLNQSANNFGTWTNAENPAVAFDVGSISSPAGTDIITQTGYTAQADRAHVITFGSPVDGVAMAIWSLGSSVQSSLLFSHDFEIVDTESGADGLVRTVTPQGYMLTGGGTVGAGAAGLIQFYDTGITEISYTVTAAEVYSGMSIALTDNSLSGSGGTPIVLDTGSPTVAITAAEVADGDMSADASLSLTFTLNRDSSNFSASDVSLNNGILTGFTGSGSVYSATLTPTNPGPITVNVAAGTFTDVFSDDNLAADEFNWTYGTDPSTNPDVVASIQAMGDVALNFGSTSLRLIDRRLIWLGRNPQTDARSRQGIKLAFADPILNEIFAGAGTTPILLADASVNAARLGHDPEGFVSAVHSETVVLAAAQVRDALGIADLNPTTTSRLLGWSIWTEGDITLGDIHTDSAQDSRRLAVTVGIDRLLSEHTLLGFALTVGQDEVDIGTHGTQLNGDSLSVSIYSSQQFEGLPTVETVVGVGRSDLDLVRVDGAETLVGRRDADIVFGALTLRKDTIDIDGLEVSPYAKLQMTRAKLDSFSETGGAFALDYRGQTVTTRFVSLGADFAWDIEAKGEFSPFAKLQLTHDFSGSSDAQMSYVGASDVYTLATGKLTDTRVKAALGFDYAVRDNLTVTSSIEREQLLGAGHFDSFTLRMSYRF